jgi:hypothetical protein
VTTTEISPARNSPHATSRHIRVDEHFARLLAEDFAVPTATVLEALDGEPQKQAMAICSWAARTDDPKSALLCWARKHRKGRCRRQSAPSRPSRRHAEISGSPQEDTDDRSRESSTRRPEDGCSLRGDLASTRPLDSTAAKPRT